MQIIQNLFERIHQLWRGSGSGAESASPSLIAKIVGNQERCQSWYLSAWRSYQLETFWLDDGMSQYVELNQQIADIDFCIHPSSCPSSSSSSSSFLLYIKAISLRLLDSSTSFLLFPSPPSHGPTHPHPPPRPASTPLVF